MTLDFSSVPTFWLWMILAVGLGTTLAVVGVAAARYRASPSIGQVGGLLLIGGAALAVSFEAAVRLFL